VWKLTVRNNSNDSKMPPAAASRCHNPSKVPSPTASSATAITTPSRTATWVSGEISGCTGLLRAEPASCAWIDPGLLAWKKPGLASFCSPAKQNVKPRKARNGSSARPRT
jgi:hypothetical protein